MSVESHAPQAHVTIITLLFLPMVTSSTKENIYLSSPNYTGKVTPELLSICGIVTVVDPQNVLHGLCFSTVLLVCIIINIEKQFGLTFL